MSTTQSFPHFCELPAELRLKIWALSFTPRVIEIRTDDYPANIEYLPTGHGTECSDICWETKSPPPPALLVCQESREEALKVYNIAFELQPFGSQIIYINTEFDIVFPFIDKWTEMLEILLEDIRAFDPSGRGARRLALEIALFAAHYSPSFGNPTKQRIAAAHRLDEVIVIVGAGPEVWGGDYVLVTPSTDAELYLWEEKAETARECFENACAVVIRKLGLACWLLGNVAR